MLTASSSRRPAADRFAGILVITAAIILTGTPCSMVIHLASAAAGHVSEFEITEELSPRSLVGTVRTNPDLADLLNSSAIRYKFRYPDTASAVLFAIDERSGDIRTSRRVDREQLCPSSSAPCYLSLDVTLLPVRYFRVIRVRIRVIDLNDNTPTFSDPRVNVEVRENAAPGTVITLPVAEDADSGEFGITRYEMTSLPDPSADYPFKLTVRRQAPSSSDGDDDVEAAVVEVFLTVTGRLDREDRSTYSLRLTAYDGGQPAPLSGTVDVTIVVADANDNSPRFDTASYETDVLENQPSGTTIIRVHAVDPDDGLNGEVSYRISGQSPMSNSGSSSSSTGGGPFAVNNKSGEIYLVGELDAEQHAGYQLTIVAADGGIGSLPAYARVAVRVIDTNDNQPTIAINPLTISGNVEVIENSAAGAFAALVSARDADSGKNGAVDCSLTAGNNRFRLEPVSADDGGSGDYKLTTTVTFDRETTDRHYVTLRCADNGRPSQSSNAEVEIHIVDENDNAPLFDGGPLYAVALSEGNYVGTVVAVMNATDLDSGANAQLTYEMETVDGTPEGAAEIDTQTGIVYATISFDYETRQEYRYVDTCEIDRK